jgi:hypothetical protein
LGFYIYIYIYITNRFDFALDFDELLDKRGNYSSDKEARSSFNLKKHDDFFFRLPVRRLDKLNSLPHRHPSLQLTSKPSDFIIECHL